jgi:hypothetical protein
MSIDPFAYFWLQEQSRAVPGMLWHYTIEKGLKGILESGTLWASAAPTLNDYQEMQRGTEFVSARMETTRHKAFANDWRQAVSDGFIANSYIASLSAAYDDLSQWRGYAKESQGFAVGFD